jgi:methionyl-tRNA formyltransferase
MNFKDLRIVFMGTPEFARASLQYLHESGCRIVGVVTASDKPAGRGMKLQYSAVKAYALEHQLPILQPEKLKNPEFLEELKNFHADIQIVVAFRMLPELVWNMPPMGTINLHASLLPDYRGAAPINWAIIRGEEKTGITTFRLKHVIDTGNILLQQEMPIGDDETAGELHDRMMTAGAMLLLQTIHGLTDGSLKEKAQDFASDTELKQAPKIFTETCRINWDNRTEDIYNLIRGLSPFPAAFTIFQNKIFKIYSADKEVSRVTEMPGNFRIENGRLKFTCANGYIYPKLIQSEGKKKMYVEDFLRGLRIT